MKVFLSWSGKRSHRVAVILRGWLPQVIQVLDPYVSSEDIDKGVRWSVDIAKELESSTFGILCVTADNLEAPWLNFEAGALSKALDKSRVTPLLIGVKPADVKGPLVQFQATVIDRDDMWRLILTLNNQCGDARLDEPRLNRAFDKWWPELESLMAEVSESPTLVAKATSGGAILEEILETVRSQQRQLVTMFERFETMHDELAIVRDRQAVVLQPRARSRARSFPPNPLEEGSTRIHIVGAGNGYDITLFSRNAHAVYFLSTPSALREFLDHIHWVHDDMFLEHAANEGVSFGVPLAVDQVYASLSLFRSEPPASRMRWDPRDRNTDEA